MKVSDLTKYGGSQRLVEILSSTGVGELYPPQAEALLRTRLVYGVREGLLPLVSLHGIGRVRARSLHNAGYVGVQEIREAPVEDLAKVTAIGRSIAEDIKRQVEAEIGEGWRSSGIRE